MRGLSGGGAAAEPDEDEMPCEAHLSEHGQCDSCNGRGNCSYGDEYEGNLHVCEPCAEHCDEAAELKHEQILPVGSLYIGTGLERSMERSMVRSLVHSMVCSMGCSMRHSIVRSME